MPKFRLAVCAVLFLVPLCLLPFVTHRLIAEERAFGRETGRAYLRATAEAWALRAARGERLPEAGSEPGMPAVALAVVDGTGHTVVGGRPFPEDGRCYGEVRLSDKPVRALRATWPGDLGRGQRRARRLNVLEGLAYGVSGLMLLVGVAALLRTAARARAEARRRLDFVADVSHRLKTPLTSISLCAELMKSGRLDESRTHESVDTIAGESAKLGRIVDDVLARIREMRRG